MGRVATVLKYGAATLGVSTVAVVAAAVATPLPLERVASSGASRASPAGTHAARLGDSATVDRTAAGDAGSACPVLNGSMSADVMQQLARHQGSAGGAQLVLGVNKAGARVYASEADLQERDLAVLEWHVRTARRAGLQVPPDVLSARDRARADLRATRRGWLS